MIRGFHLQSAAAKLDLAQADLQTQIANANYKCNLRFLFYCAFLFGVARSLLGIARGLMYFSPRKSRRYAPLLLLV